jgi:ammonium transporter, Amt family
MAMAPLASSQASIANADPAARILIVDDDRATCLVLQRVLQQDGYQVEVARDGTTAIELCRASDHDVILLDYVLPDIDGVNVCAAIRKQQAHASSPILMLTSRNDDLAVKAALAAGASDFITKPFLAPVLRQRVRHLVLAQRAEKLLRHIAYHDPLTGLANRALFHDRLTQLLEPSNPEAAGNHAVMCLDLDRFKIVNDACGHSAGDELLRQLSVLFQSNLRQTDMLARLGGDEFGALLLDCSRADALSVGEKLRQAVSQFCFYWEGRMFTVGVSIGVALLTGEVTQPVTVLADADSACYSAKKSGRNRVKIYEASTEDLRRRRGDSNWQQHIQHALSQNGFALSAQRIHVAKPGLTTTRHIEIQVHMLDESGAAIASSAFTTPAERFGMTSLIDRWVVTNTLSVMQRRHAWSSNHSVCWIPVSGATIADPSFAAFLLGELVRFNAPGSGVCLQISEQSLLANLAPASKVMETLHAQELLLAVDDFSGLAAFRAMPLASIQFLKIDSSLLTNIATNPLDSALVKAISDVAHAMNIKTVSKYDSAVVLSDSQAGGIDFIQGISPPGPLEDTALVD